MGSGQRPPGKVLCANSLFYIIPQLSEIFNNISEKKSRTANRHGLGISLWGMRGLPYAGSEAAAQRARAARRVSPRGKRSGRRMGVIAGPPVPAATGRRKHHWAFANPREGKG